MNRLLAVAFPLALGACQLPGGAVVIPPITEPQQVQDACVFLAAAAPIAERFRSAMTVAQQALLTSAEGALAACAAGNATGAVLDLALGLEQYLTGQGVPKAAIMAQAPQRAVKAR